MSTEQRGKPKLRLYVAGMSTRSSIAITNLRGICEQHCKNGFELEVIDVFQHPDMAEMENIVAAPTLIRMLPPPLRRLIGDMTDKDRVILVLET